MKKYWILTVAVTLVGMVVMAQSALVFSYDPSNQQLDTLLLQVTTDGGCDFRACATINTDGGPQLRDCVNGSFRAALNVARCTNLMQAGLARWQAQEGFAVDAGGQ